MKTWEELLSDRWQHITDQYGPRSHQVWSAIEVICDTRWFKHVGEAAVRTDVAVVTSWSEAMEIVRDGQKYDEQGHLREPVAIVWPTTRIPRYSAWWEAAREAALRNENFAGFIPKTLDEDVRDWMWEHLYTFVSLVLAEVIASDELASTYFREQLEWYVAGHFPCGWEGEWPKGRMRVW
jgi:hypothetical protein